MDDFRGFHEGDISYFILRPLPSSRLNHGKFSTCGTGSNDKFAFLSANLLSGVSSQSVSFLLVGTASVLLSAPNCESQPELKASGEGEDGLAGPPFRLRKK